MSKLFGTFVRNEPGLSSDSTVVYKQNELSINIMNYNTFDSRKMTDC